MTLTVLTSDILVLISTLSDNSPNNPLQRLAMFAKTFILALSLSLAASALKVTAPTNSTGWESKGSQIISWDVSFVFFPPDPTQRPSPTDPSSPSRCRG